MGRMQGAARPLAQRGVAAMALLWLLAAAALGLLLSAANSAPTRDPKIADRQALRQAKQALLAYAVSSHERSPGRYLALPCPDTHNAGLWEEGVSHGSCGSRHRSALGRLPWRTLGLPPLRDAAGECIWYAVSGAVKSNPSPYLANTDTAGDMQVHAGSQELTAGGPRQLALAALIAPGAPTQAQQRRRGNTICGDDKPEAYMEGANSKAGTAWRHTATDSMAFISAQELQSALTARDDMWRQLGSPAQDSLLRRAAKCLAEYAKANGKLPWPAPASLHDLRDDKAYDDSSGATFGRLPDKINDSGAKARLSRDCAHLRATMWRRLWQNWKDHLFYAMSHQPCTQRCPSYDGRPYAAIVWFAGKRRENQQRNNPADPHDWLESLPPGSSASYPKASGNDTALCITTAHEVEQCRGA